jgi:acyl dehydratase
MRFATEITLTGPVRSPAQLLAEQSYDGHPSVHDGDTAASLGLAGAPIEGPTHFSQFDPLAVAVWGPAWFEHGCISAHFRNMVVAGEQVQASLTTTGADLATIEAHTTDGRSVLTGTVSVGPEHPETELEARRGRQGDPGELFIVDQLDVGARVVDDEPVAITQDEGNGPLYPFSLAQKLEQITEPHPWYTADGGRSSPWGRAIVPMEMISVLANKAGKGFPVRTPSLGLFLDLEVRLLAGPVFVGQSYRVEREIVGLSQSRRTESYWTRTTLTDVDTGAAAAAVLLHSGVFKESYPGYPAERLLT